MIRNALFVLVLSLVSAALVVWLLRTPKAQMMQ